ncbi:MAG: type IV pilus biogenesis protein PilM [Acidobacteriota bacterium]
MTFSFLQSPPPDVGVEIAPGHVAASRVTWRGSVATVSALRVEPLPAGVVAPGLLAANVIDAAVVGDAVSRAVAGLGGRVHRIALILPDPVAKVSLVKFDSVPPRAEDIRELVRWQVRKSAPFPIEQALVSFSPGAKAAEGGQEFVVSVARSEVVAQYEQACQRAGLHAGLVDLSTFSLVNGVLGTSGVPDGDWLLVHVTPSYTTLAVLRGGDLMYFRNRAEETEGTLADVVHQTAMYYEDRLKGRGFGRVLLSGGGAASAGNGDVRASLQERLGLAVESVEPKGGVLIADRITPSPALADTLVPLIGILVRERKAA